MENMHDMQVGHSGENVKQTQTMLKQIGLYGGEETGEYDEGTYNSVKMFQQVSGMRATGYMDEETMDGLCKAMGMQEEKKEEKMPKKKEKRGKEYIVKKGDSLWGIAQGHDVTVHDLMAYNGLESTVLQIGQKLIIHEDMSSVSMEIPAEDPYADRRPEGYRAPRYEEERREKKMYTVKAGDSLYKIAMAHRTSIEEIMMANGLNNPYLAIGQQIMIPAYY